MLEHPIRPLPRRDHPTPWVLIALLIFGVSCHKGHANSETTPAGFAPAPKGSATTLIEILEVSERGLAVQEMHVITSTAVLEKVVQDLAIDEIYKDDPTQSPVDRLRGFIKVEPVIGTRMLRVVAHADVPELSDRIATSLVKAYQEHARNLALEQKKARVDALSRWERNGMESLRRNQEQLIKLRKSLNHTDQLTEVSALSEATAGDEFLDVFTIALRVQNEEQKLSKVRDLIEFEIIAINSFPEKLLLVHEFTSAGKSSR